MELKRRDDEACDDVIKVGDALAAERRAHARTKRRLVELRRAVRKLADIHARSDWPPEAFRLRAILVASDGRRR